MFVNNVLARDCLRRLLVESLVNVIFYMIFLMRYVVIINYILIILEKDFLF